MIYLDSGATTLEKPPAVAQAMARAVGEMSSPGRGNYPASQRAAQTAFACREAAAELFSVPSPEQVVFTGNATHGLNIAIRTLVRPGSRVAVSGYEHNAVTRVLHSIRGGRYWWWMRRCFGRRKCWRAFGGRCGGAWMP